MRGQRLHGGSGEAAGQPKPREHPPQARTSAVARAVPAFAPILPATRPRRRSAMPTMTRLMLALLAFVDPRPPDSGRAAYSDDVVDGDAVSARELRAANRHNGSAGHLKELCEGDLGLAQYGCARGVPRYSTKALRPIQVNHVHCGAWPPLSVRIAEKRVVLSCGELTAYVIDESFAVAYGPDADTIASCEAPSAIRMSPPSRSTCTPESPAASRGDRASVGVDAPTAATSASARTSATDASFARTGEGIPVERRALTARAAPTRRWWFQVVFRMFQLLTGLHIPIANFASRAKT